MLTLLPHNHPLLRQKQPEFDTEQDLEHTAKHLIASLMAYKALGLAAPQIGIVGRAIAIRMNERPVVLFNPEITHQSLEQQYGEEGCLSFPDFYLKRNRSLFVGLKYYDYEKQQTVEILAAELPACIIQHEVDHLDGILFFDGISRPKIQAAIKRSRRNYSMKDFIRGPMQNLPSMAMELGSMPAG